MTQAAQQLIVPVNQVFLTVHRGNVIRDKSGKSSIQRLVCAKHKGKFYIHASPHLTDVDFNNPNFDFFMPSADLSAEHFIDRIKEHGSVNFSSEYWKEVNERDFKSGLEDALLEEYSLKDEYKQSLKKAA